jgi:predicted kinase
MREPFEAYVKEAYEGAPVVIACGLPATNKTETMEVVARAKGYRILRTDMIRRELLKDTDIFNEKVASDMGQRTRVYAEMFRLAGETVAGGRGVILDATFVTQDLRRRAAEVAARHGRTFIIQQTRCSQEYSLNKISKRTKENYESNALTDQAYLNNKAKFEDVDLDDLKGRFPGLEIVHLTVDTESDLEEDWRVVRREDRA